MQQLLKKYFGFETFRPLQEEIVQSALSGKDALVVMPTGSGKSLCYQLPALALSGLTLVISPLIALMKDQVDGLRTNGIAAAYINSTLPAQENRMILEQAQRGELKLLYIAPERLAIPMFADFLRTLRISLITVDEAHCISEWGHDFRPDYRNLARLRELLPSVPWMALTATANDRVRKDIVAQLKLERGNIFLSGFNRPNLTYLVRPKQKWFPLLVCELEHARGSSAIIYCFSRNGTEKLAKKLRDHGLQAAAYHAGLTDQERRSTQDKFIRDACPIIVATVAFGMGIDKPNVRLVVHADLPKSVEGYYQETGRAGRDGLPSRCLLMYSAGDRWKQEYFIRMMSDQLEQTRAREQLLQMSRYAETTTCRRHFLLDYFGEKGIDPTCTGCDVCLGEQAMLASTAEKTDFDEVLFERLRILRRHLADERGVPSYVIFGDRTLQEMSRLFPQQLTSLDRITGVGAQKRANFGAEFIAKIREYASEVGGRMDGALAEPLSDTLALTKELVLEKCSLAEIARRRDLAQSTIVNHLEKIRATEDLNIEHLCPAPERVKAIRDAMKKNGSTALTPARQRLGDGYSYEEIRVVRLFLG